MTPAQYLGGALIILAVVLVATRSSRSVTENAAVPKDPFSHIESLPQVSHSGFDNAISDAS